MSVRVAEERSRKRKSDKNDAVLNDKVVKKISTEELNGGGSKSSGRILVGAPSEGSSKSFKTVSVEAPSEGSSNGKVKTSVARKRVTENGVLSTNREAEVIKRNKEEEVGNALAIRSERPVDKVNYGKETKQSLKAVIT